MSPKTTPSAPSIRFWVFSRWPWATAGAAPLAALPPLLMRKLSSRGRVARRQAGGRQGVARATRQEKGRWQPSAVVVQPVADARLRQDMPGLFRVGLQLLAQLPYVDAQILDVAAGFKPPHFAQQMLVGQDLSSMDHKLL